MNQASHYSSLRDIANGTFILKKSQVDSFSTNIFCIIMSFTQLLCVVSKLFVCICYQTFYRLCVKPPSLFLTTFFDVIFQHSYSLSRERVYYFLKNSVNPYCWYSNILTVDTSRNIYRTHMWCANLLGAAHIAQSPCTNCRTVNKLVWNLYIRNPWRIFCASLRT